MANTLAKLAQFQAFEPWRGAPGLPMPMRSNDNQRSVYAARARQWASRPVLVCRWHLAPTGGLECCWHLEAREGALRGSTRRRRQPPSEAGGRIGPRSFQRRSGASATR